MSYPVYSTRLLKLYNVTGFWQTTVPAGYTCVIKTVASSNWDAAKGQVSVAVIDAQVMYDEVPGVTGHVTRSMHQVAYAGEVVKGYLSHLNMSLICSGYLLRNVGLAIGKHLELEEADPPEGWTEAELLPS